MRALFPALLDILILSCNISASNDELKKNLQRKESEMKILHGKIGVFFSTAVAATATAITAVAVTTTAAAVTKTTIPIETLQQWQQGRMVAEKKKWQALTFVFCNVLDSYQYQIRKERERREELENELTDLRGKN